MNGLTEQELAQGYQLKDFYGRVVGFQFSESQVESIIAARVAALRAEIATRLAEVAFSVPNSSPTSPVPGAFGTTPVVKLDDALLIARGGSGD